MNFEKTLINIIKKYFILILVVSISFGIAFAGYKTIKYKKEYVAKASVMVFDKRNYDSSKVPVENDKDLIPFFGKLIKSSVVLRGVTSKLDNGVKESELKKMISYESGTKYFDVTVKARNEKEAITVLSLLLEEMDKVGKDLLQYDYLTIIDFPSDAHVTEKPNLLMYFVSGFFGGLFLTTAILFVFRKEETK